MLPDPEFLSQCLQDVFEELKSASRERIKEKSVIKEDVPKGFATSKKKKQAASNVKKANVSKAKKPAAPKTKKPATSRAKKPAAPKAKKPNASRVRKRTDSQARKPDGSEIAVSITSENASKQEAAKELNA